VLRRSIESAARLARASFASVGLDRMSTRLGIALLLVSSIFFAANFADKAWVSYQVARQKQDLLTQIAQTNQQIVQLNSDLKYMHTRPYYVQAARQFDYAEPGDIPVSISAAPAPAQAPVQQRARPAVKPATHHESIFRRLLEAIVPGL
jgi:hypothetical protein